MGHFRYNEEKNNFLINTRNISFDDVIFHIGEGKLLDIIDHPNQEKYIGQKLLIVEIDNYAYVVPYILEKEGNIFLKTIFPSRKATLQYLGKNDEKR